MKLFELFLLPRSKVYFYNVKYQSKEINCTYKKLSVRVACSIIVLQETYHTRETAFVVEEVMEGE